MKINGKQYAFETKSVTEVLRSLQVPSNEVVVEVNGEIVPKSDFDTYIIDKEALVELVAFVGGG